jgi:hypothetical protein
LADEDLADDLTIGHADGHGTASGPIVSPDLPATLAPASHRQGGGTAEARGKMILEGACVSCHGWTSESPISSFATLTGTWAVNDPSGTNVIQVVLSGTK